MKKLWRVAGINFAHMHMGDHLRTVHEHPHAEIVGICDPRPEAMDGAVQSFALDASLAFTDYRECLEQTKPDLVVLCPPTAEHAEWVERVAPFHVPMIIEKPFAANLDDADRMIAAMRTTGQQLMINWPLRWVASHVTTHRLINEGCIGEVLEVHYYDGNRGPLYHGADKVEREPNAAEKSRSWWYRQDAGGGSLRDYLGYGVTLGAWFNDSQQPLEVTAVVDATEGLEVDEQSVTIVRYATGLSTFQTRWGTFTDPWTHQPQPKCGFVIRGTRGTISSYDYEPTVRIQTAERPAGYDEPVDELPVGERNAIQYMLACLAENRAIEGPLSPQLSRLGQQLVDAAIRSVEEQRTVRLSEG